MRAVLIVLALTLALGIGIGKSAGPDPVVKYKVIHDTETITETVEVEVPAPVDISCVRAFRYANELANAAHVFDLQGTEIIRITSELRKAVFNKDYNTGTALENETRALNSDSIGASEVLGLTLPRFEEAAAECKETLR